MNAVRAIAHAQAAAAIDAIRAELDRIGKSAVIAVVDAHGELVAFLRMDGTQIGSVAIACNKAYTAARLRRTTRELGARVRERGVDTAWYGDSRYTGFGGGVPVMHDGACIGGIGVSALSDEEDEALASLGAAAIVQTKDGVRP